MKRKRINSIILSYLKYFYILFWKALILNCICFIKLYLLKQPLQMPSLQFCTSGTDTSVSAETPLFLKVICLCHTFYREVKGLKLHE